MNTLEYQDLNQFRMPSGFRGRSATICQLWWLIQDTLFRWSPQVFFGWRVFLLRLFGAKIGAGVQLRPTVRVTYPWKLEIGNNVWIGEDVVFYNLGQITIGSNVAISYASYLCTGMHEYTEISFPIYAQPIVVEDEVWFGSDVFIAPGVKIGRGAIVGARSTVLKSMPGGMICYGNPAKPIRPRLMRSETCTGNEAHECPKLSTRNG